MIKNNNYLVINKQHIIHYYYKESTNNLPVIIFLHGYASDIKGKKALFLKELCNKLDIGLLMFEYRGHGKSSGDIFKFTLEHWLNDVIIIIQQFTKNKKKILIGSSLGGWLSFVYALKFPKLIKAIIAIAPAVDFTEIIKTQTDIKVDSSDENKIQLNNKDGTFTTIHKNLLNTPQEMILLNRNVINLDMPIRILHGMKDSIVNYQTSIEFAEKLLSQDVKLIFNKEGDHTLSTKNDLNCLAEIIKNIAT